MLKWCSLPGCDEGESCTRYISGDMDLQLKQEVSDETLGDSSQHIKIEIRSKI